MEIGMVGGCDFQYFNGSRRHHEREPGWRRSRRAARRVVNTAGGESSSLAYRTVHWRKLKPAKHVRLSKYQAVSLIQRVLDFGAATHNERRCQFRRVNRLF